MRQQVGKQCSRCGGSMMPERDSHGEYLACLQCGHSVDMLHGSEVKPASREELGYARPRRSTSR